MSKFYNTDPEDPDAPVLLDYYRGSHGSIRPGDKVRYTGQFRMPEGPHTVTELYCFYGEVGSPDYHVAILDDGDYEVDADNLEKVPDA